jgi:hypothetical protein
MWIFAPSRICAELYHRDSPDSCFAGDQQLVPIGIETAVNEIRALRNLQGILLKHVLASRFFDNTECMFCGGPRIPARSCRSADHRNTSWGSEAETCPLDIILIFSANFLVMSL